ncbi:GrpB family protein [Dactylosporangium sp. NBC_01737]|uniref:GrpB family protein n=1 Tax=Dactylosporangium sp. NBC_01737 TaxID=2975959 RepID=UPI002E10FEE4|nr:GrpB family protein [Dactylosporangium sp. NBC_01737]
MTAEFAADYGGPLDLVDYDQGWPAKFAYYRDELADALGPVALRIEHIGSTAVPGLAAKNVIDILVVVADEHDREGYRAAVESTGMALAHRDPAASWSFYRPAAPPRTRHVHVTSRGSSHERVQLLFVDFLRNHDLAADAYAQVKRRLAIRFADDRERYTRAKTEFIFDMLDRAEQWADQTGWTVEQR